MSAHEMVDHPALIDRAELDEFFRLVRGGLARAKAAEAATGMRLASVERRVERLQLLDEYVDALEDARRARADMVDARFDEWVNEEKCSPALRIVWAKRWNHSYRERVEVTGADGGPLRVAAMTVDPVEVMRILREAGIDDDGGSAVDVSGPGVLSA